MFSKRCLAIAMLVIVLLNFGCGLNTGEKPVPRSPPMYSGDNFSCVARIPENFDKYVNDRLSEKEITVFIQCIQKAFTTFAQLTRGREVSTYTPNEIRNFLHEFFLGQRRISDDLLAQMMLIKRAIVGGEVDRISRTELYQAVEALEDLRKEAIRVKPYLKVLNPTLAMKEEPTKLGQRLAEANAVLNQSIQVLQSRMRQTKCDYPLKDLRTFLIEARAFVGWEKHFGDKAVPVDNWINFLKIFRELTVAPSDPNVVRTQDWAPMLQSFAQWYSAYLQYRVGVKDRPVLQGFGLQNTVHLAREVFNLIEDSVSRQEGFTVPFDKLTELTNALHGLGWIPKFRPESLQTALRAMVTRVLGNPDVLPGARKDEGLTLASVSRARNLFYQWAYVQMNLDARYRKPEPAVTASANVPNLQIKPFLNPDVRARLKDLRNSDWDEFLRVRTLMRPLFPDDKYRVLLVPREDIGKYQTTHGFHNLSMMNLMRTIVGVIFRGYAEGNGNRLDWQSGISSAEMQKFYEDFREAGIDLGLVDRRNTNTGARAFIEGNLFNYSSDGLLLDTTDPKSKLNFLEAMEMFSFLWSGGGMAEDAYKALSVCEKGPLDDNRRPKLRRDCVLERLPEVLDPLLDTMPGLQQFLRLSPPQVRASYVSTLLDTAFSPKYSKREWVELSELSTLMVVMHYAEAVLTRYDKNHDAALTNGEIDVAAGLFMGFIKKFAKEQLDKDLGDRYAKASFYYILTYREMPVGLSDIFWMAWISEGSLNLNRAELSNVFRVIIAKLFETGKKTAVASGPTPAENDALRAACHDFIKMKSINPPPPFLADRSAPQVDPSECGQVLDTR